MSAENGTFKPLASLSSASVVITVQNLSGTCERFYVGELAALALDGRLNLPNDLVFSTLWRIR